MMQFTKKQMIYIGIGAGIILGMVLMILAVPKDEVLEVGFKLVPDLNYVHVLEGEEVNLELKYEFIQGDRIMDNQLTEEEIEQAIALEEIEITSSNEEVVSVVEGVAAAVKAGDAVLTIKGKKSLCEVELRVWVGEYASSIKTVKSLELQLDSTRERILFSFEPYSSLGQYTFEIEDEEIASIDVDGKVTPLMVGDTIVTLNLLSVEGEIIDAHEITLTITE